MDLFFFYKMYDLKEIDIEKAYFMNDKLYLEVCMPVEIELIANGYRPEINIQERYVLILSSTSTNEFIITDIKIKEYQYVNGRIHLKINDLDPFVIDNVQIKRQEFKEITKK